MWSHLSEQELNIKERELRRDLEEIENIQCKRIYAEHIQCFNTYGFCIQIFHDNHELNKYLQKSYTINKYKIKLNISIQYNPDTHEYYNVQFIFDEDPNIDILLLGNKFHITKFDSESILDEVRHNKVKLKQITPILYNVEYMGTIYFKIQSIPTHSIQNGDILDRDCIAIIEIYEYEYCVNIYKFNADSINFVNWSEGCIISDDIEGIVGSMFICNKLGG